MNNLSPGSYNPSAGISTPGQAFHQQVQAGAPRARTFTPGKALHQQVQAGISRARTPSLPSATSEEPRRATEAQWEKADFDINQLPLTVLMNYIREIPEEPTVTGTEQFS